MLKKTTGIQAVLALTLALAGCVACPAAGPSPTAAANETPAPTAAATSAAPSAPRETDAGQPLSTDEALIAQYAEVIGSTPEKDFTLADLDGAEWTLSALKGRIVLLNFWATWCGPCQQEMPHFQSLWDRFGAEGDVVVLTVVAQSFEGLPDEIETRKAVAAFIGKQGFTFPVLIDGDDSVWAFYQQPGIPANYIIDRQGNIRLLQPSAFAGEGELYAALEAVRRVSDE